MSTIAVSGFFDKLLDSGISYYIDNTYAIVALVLTIISELLIFFIIILRRVPKNEIRLWIIFIIGLNCLSNPAAQLLYSTNYFNFGLTINFMFTEFIVIIVEALLIYVVMLPVFSRALLYSMLLNGSSILIGELLCALQLIPWCS